jgi:hypothetical protein
MMPTTSASSFAGRENGLPHHLARHVIGTVEQRDDLLRLLGHLREHLVTVQRLAAGEEPDLVGREVGDDAAAHHMSPWGCCP